MEADQVKTLLSDLKATPVENQPAPKTQNESVSQTPQHDEIHTEEQPQKTGFVNPQLIFAWIAPLRAYKKRGKNIMRFYIALALILSLLVLFFGDKILLLPIWATLFLFYVLTITPPPDVENKIMKFGVETAGITLRWDMLSHFYFTKRFGFNILTLVSKQPYYFHSYLIVGDDIKDHVTHLLAEHIVFMEVPDRSFTDKLVDWLTLLIPDDDENKEESTKAKPSSFAQTHAQTSP